MAKKSPPPILSVMPSPRPARLEQASSAIARDINRDNVLDLIRACQPIARADISRRSGLQPSTISQIVEQLLAERWIVEGATSARARGRKPTPLTLNGDLLILSIDVHPAHAIVAVMDLQNRMLMQEHVPLRSNPTQAVDALVEAIERIRAAYPGKTFEGIGMSLPGRVDPERNELLLAPNLGWTGFDLAGALQRRCGLKVEMENDANICLIDALWSGKLSKYRNVVLVTVTDGIGASILVNGQMVCGKAGLAGEFGHIALDPHGPLCGCGRRGCWEMFASTRATLRFYAEASGAHAPATIGQLLHMADAGDTHALQALRNQALQLARGLQVVITALAPELVMVTVDGTLAWPEFDAIVRAEMASQMLAGEPPRLWFTTRSELTRLRGAAALVLQRHAGYHSCQYSSVNGRVIPMRKVAAVKETGVEVYG